MSPATILAHACRSHHQHLCVPQDQRRLGSEPRTATLLPPIRHAPRSCTCGVQPPLRSAGEKLDLDKERKVRTPQEMAAEAAELRTLFL